MATIMDDDAEDEVDSGETRIRVAVRLRPYNEKELCAVENQRQAWVVHNSRTLLEDSLHAIEGTSCNLLSRKEYLFDHVFGPESHNTTVYDKLVLPVVTRFVSGFNGTVFAYGQTSSGKTHTLIGTAQDPGTLPVAIHDVFHLMSDMDKSIQFLIRVCYMEIYNDQLSDLLEAEEGEYMCKSDSLGATARTATDMSASLRSKCGSPTGATLTGGGTDRLRLRETPQTGWFIEGLKDFLVRSPDEALALMAAGERRKHIAETNMNQRSSRSHTIFRLTLESRKEGGPTVVSVLNLVDLAGSESVKKAGTSGNVDRFKEGTQINRSLLTLGTVIHKLSEVELRQHIPYRDSTLTKVLASSLGGNSNTAVVAALSPAFSNLQESRNTLLFASRAAKIVNKTEKVVLTEGSTIEKYKREIELLRRKLAEMKACEHEMDAEKRLKDVLKLIRISTHSEVDGQRVLKGLLAVTTGLRTMAEVSDELGLSACGPGVSDDEGDAFPDTDRRLLDTKSLAGSGGEDRPSQRSLFRRQLSSLEIQNVIRLSQLHQNQVLSERGTDAMVDVTSSNRRTGSITRRPLDFKPEDEEMARYLRGAAIGMPVEVLERIRATSPTLLREALLGAISLTPKQEQQDCHRQLGEHDDLKKDKRTALAHDDPRDEQTDTSDLPAAREATTPTPALPQAERAEDGGRAVEGPGTQAVDMVEAIRAHCKEMRGTVAELTEALDLSTRANAENDEEDSASLSETRPSQESSQVKALLQDLRKAADRADEEASCLVTEILHLNRQAKATYPPCPYYYPPRSQLTSNPKQRLEAIITNDHLQRLRAQATDPQMARRLELEAELRAAQERASLAISESLKIAMAATARSNARCHVAEHEARQSIRMAESVRPSVTQVYLNSAPTSTTIRTSVRPTGLQAEFQGTGAFGSTMAVRRSSSASEAPVITISTRHIT